MFPGAKPDFDLDDELPVPVPVGSRSGAHQSVGREAATPGSSPRRPPPLPSRGHGFDQTIHAPTVHAPGPPPAASAHTARAARAVSTAKPRRRRRRRGFHPSAAVRRAFTVAAFSAFGGLCVIALSAPPTRMMGLEPLFGTPERLGWNEVGLHIGQGFLVFAAVLTFFAALSTFADHAIDDAP